GPHVIGIKPSVDPCPAEKEGSVRLRLHRSPTSLERCPVGKGREMRAKGHVPLWQRRGPGQADRTTSGAESPNRIDRAIRPHTGHRQIMAHLARKEAIPHTEIGAQGPEGIME